MDLGLTGRTALVTGASSGIGAAIAVGLAKEGARVAITARRADRLQATAEAIVAAGGRAPVIIASEITGDDDAAHIAGEALAGLGTIDILANCAGGSRPITVDADEAVWDEAFRLNFTSIRRLTGALLPGMRSRGFGRVINISGSMEPRSLNAAMAAKAALHLWAKGLAADVARDGVTINTIAPGRIKSEQILTKLHPTEQSRVDFIARNIPIGYFGEAEDLAVVAVFLASPLARYVTGTVIPVDGAMRASAH